ncbi:hypothetical protein [Roseisolibacter sp. H3M3-2]|uniref:hypothetical protein n=1 Tax=Roseisolibacter sp. H3M3-2 TaxID=3031323 RepID=UPI0023DC0284|nr:hypothetical protein [Roseisolibacter sp. H3M3-2]MDF1503432.1 hypothetical protein [Roseisolibacter sp. H3M3-2]
MKQDDRPADHSYPLGRGYGHDYMRGGEVFGGYGYSERAEYARRRGENDADAELPDTGQRRRSDDGD